MVEASITNDKSNQGKNFTRQKNVVKWQTISRKGLEKRGNLTIWMLIWHQRRLESHALRSISPMLCCPESSRSVLILSEQRNGLSKTPQVQDILPSKECSRKGRGGRMPKTYHHWDIKIREGHNEQRPLIWHSLSRINQQSEKVRLCASSRDVIAGHDSIEGRSNSKLLYKNPKQNS